MLCLSSQGALTHGDRRATESRDLSKYNFENKVTRGCFWGSSAKEGPKQLASAFGSSQGREDRCWHLQAGPSLAAAAPSSVQPGVRHPGLLVTGSACASWGLDPSGELEGHWGDQPLPRGSCWQRWGRAPALWWSPRDRGGPCPLGTALGLVGLLCRVSPLLGCRCGVPLVRDSHLLSQYGAKALDRVLSTILNRTENRVPVPKSYDRREAVFFHGKNFTSSVFSGISALLLAWLVSGLGHLTKLGEREQHCCLSSSLVSRAIGHPARQRGKRAWDRLSCEITGTAGGEAALQDCWGH